MKKASNAKDVLWFEEIPNVGPRIARDFRTLGITSPEGLKGKNPKKLYDALCKKTGVHHDPCVLDTFMAAVDFMNGGHAKPWHSFTNQRKKTFPKLTRQQ